MRRAFELLIAAPLLLAGCDRCKKNQGASDATAPIADATVTPADAAVAARSPGEAQQTYFDIHEIHGRYYFLSAVEFDLPTSPPAATPFATHHVLGIAGDDLRISFASTTPPYDVGVANDEITFGAHTLQITATPGAYVVDGQAIKLDVDQVHLFVDGQARGRL